MIKILASGSGTAPKSTMRTLILASCIVLAACTQSGQHSTTIGQNLGQRKEEVIAVADSDLLFPSGYQAVRIQKYIYETGRRQEMINFTNGLAKFEREYGHRYLLPPTPADFKRMLAASTWKRAPLPVQAEAVREDGETLYVSFEAAGDHCQGYQSLIGISRTGNSGGKEASIIGWFCARSAEEANRQVADFLRGLKVK